MKGYRFFTWMTVLLLLFSAAVVPAYAAVSSPVSPALEVLSARCLTMKKSCLTGNTIGFDESDFTDALGVKNLSAVTVAALPLITEGKLMLGGLEVVQGQAISAGNLENLRFVPAFGAREASCRFTAGEEGYSLACTMYVLDTLNFAPTVARSEEQSCMTARNISLWNRLYACDPEGDAVSYEILSYPKKGVLKFSASTGDYVYTPVSGYTGHDSFTYRAVDCYGNASAEAKVSVKVEKPACNVEYTDMNGHWAQNAAVKMTAAGIMSGRQTEAGLLFEPSAEVTRREFLVMAMQAAGEEPLSAVDTGFYDDDEIPAADKGYVAAAVSRGLIHGVELDGLLCFCPDRPVTRAEAAVILSSLLTLNEPAVRAVFADGDSLPAWAESALYAMNDAGILTGTGDGYLSPFTALTRAQTAQMLTRVMERKR